jgi:hypothetical protein
MLPSLMNAFHRVFSSQPRARARAKSAARTSFRPAVEALDQRLLPTIGLSGVVLSALGTSGSDTIAIDTFVQNNNLMIRATVNAGTVNAEVRSFSAAQVTSIEIDGGDSADTINLRGDPLSTPVNVRGGSGVGVDTLLGPTAHLVGTSLSSQNVWNIGVDNTLNGNIHFFDIEKFSGGDSGSDLFQIQGTGFAGTINGGGGTDFVYGPNAMNAWNVTGANAGTLSYFDSVPVTLNGRTYNLSVGRTVQFADVENLMGGSQTDTFTLQNGQSVTGQIAGNGGTDTVDYSPYTTNVTVDFAGQIFTGAGSMSGIENFIGSSAGYDLLAAPNAKNTWSITGTDAGSLASGRLFVTFQGFEHLVGGMDADTFNFSDQARVSSSGFIEGSPDGTVEGNGNDDHLNFASYTTPITLKYSGDHGNIHWDTDPNSSATPWHNMDRFTGGSASDTLEVSDGDNMVKIDVANGGKLSMDVDFQNPQVDIQNPDSFPASGFLTFSSVENIKGGGSRDVFFMIGAGSIDAIDGGSNGQDLIDYAQYSTGVTVNLEVGTATGVKLISNVENITGSPYDDILVGSNASNIIHGGAGKDILIGGAGADSLYGGGDEDLLIGGRVTFAKDTARLQKILDVWAGPLSYTERVKTLRSDLDSTSVPADGDIDHVFGGDEGPNGVAGPDTSLDWFWIYNGDISNWASNEALN